MPSRNAKIIVSASLMVAMVLPVSVATFVQAGSEPDNQPGIPVVDDATKNYVNGKIEELSSKNDASVQDDLDLEKLQLVQQWIEAQENGDAETVHLLSAQITADFPPDDEYSQGVDSPD